MQIISIDDIITTKVYSKGNKKMTMTKVMNEQVREQLKMERELLGDEVFNLIRKIEPIKPIYYYNRLICELFPESEYADLIGNNYGESGKKENSKRNELIRKAIKTNIQSNRVKLNPNTVFEDVDDILTRNDHGIAAGFTREKVFLVALAFNLTYAQMTNLLVHCLGERKINFRDPYEVILAYCLIEHTHVFEHYSNLVNKYEKKIKEKENTNENFGTLYYETQFNNIDDDEALLNFLITLPRDTKSSTPLVIFKEIYRKIEKYLSIESRLDYIENLSESLEKKGYFWSFDAILSDQQYRQRIYKAGLITTNQVAEELVGKRFRKNAGTFRFLKKKVFSKEDLRGILNGRIDVTKESLILILFYKYCLSGDRDTKIEEIDDNDFLLEGIYDNFKETIGGDLEDAGFSDIYLPNAFERLILFCLVSENPIKTFNMIMSAEND